MRTKKLKSIISIIMVFVLLASSMVYVSATNNTSKKEHKMVTLVANGEKALWADGCIKEVTEIDAIKWYLNEKDNTYYLFMPTNVNLSSVKLMHNFDQFTIEGKKVNSGDTFNFEKDKVYSAKCDLGDVKLKVMQSSSIGTMFLTTESGSLDNIHADKDHRESGEIVIVDKNGNVDYDGVLDQIKGRGNTTWRLDKKPYNIKLGKTASIFGIHPSKRYSLLANAQEHTGLRNKIMYDLSNDVGLSYSPESEFADMYVNGEYQGTYQVCEKVEIGKNNLVRIYDLEKETEKANDVDSLKGYPIKNVGRGNGSYKYAEIPKNPADISGGYLLEYEHPAKYDEEACGFVTSRSQYVVIKDPEYASKEQVEYIRDFVQKAEDAFYAKSGYNADGKHFGEYYDLDDAARMYLMQEYSVNIDSGISSCFFFKDIDSTATDGKGSKLHAGPTWDYDVALGNLANRKDNVLLTDTDKWFAKIAKLYQDNRNTVFAQLCTQKSFWSVVEKVYNEDFVPAMDILLKDNKETGWLMSYKNYQKRILDSINMNYVVWEHTLRDEISTPQKGYTHESNIKYLDNFMTKRYDWLNEQLYISETGVLGDTNLDGRVDITDATLLQKYVASIEGFNETQLRNADVNKDGYVDITDATQIQKNIAGIS